MMRPGEPELCCDVCGVAVSSFAPCGVCGPDPRTVPSNQCFVVCENCAEKHFAEHVVKGELKPAEPLPPLSQEQRDAMLSDFLKETGAA